MPGTFVAIGLNSPRISDGRLGLDLPHVLVRRTAAQEDVDHRLVRDRVPARASARNKSASDNDIRLPIDRPPMRMKSRRRNPSQHVVFSLEPKIVSIERPSRKVSSFKTFRLVVMQ